MPYEDYEDKREYQKKYMREYRNQKGDSMSEEKTKVRPDKDISPDDYKTAEGLLQAVAEEIANIKRLEGVEPVTRAKVVSNLVRTGIKVFEVSEITERVEELEKIAKNKKVV